MTVFCYFCRFCFRLILIAALMLVLVACVKNLRTVGYTFDPTSLKGLQQGKSTAQDITERLGSPSARSDYGNPTWYYIHTTYENVAFFKPKIKQQTVIAVEFDEKYRLDNIKKYTQNHAKAVAFSSDTTPTEGHDLGVAEQLLGNIGRFSSERSPLRY